MSFYAFYVIPVKPAVGNNIFLIKILLLNFFLRKICNINCLKCWKDINGKKALKTIKEDYLRDTKTTFKVSSI